MTSLTRTEEDYVINTALGRVPESQRKVLCEGLQSWMSLMDTPGRNSSVDLLAQGHRLVELAWLSIEFRMICIMDPTTASQGPPNVLITLEGALRICFYLSLTGSKFIELWKGCGENAKTFLEEIAYRYALEQDASGSVC